VVSLPDGTGHRLTSRQRRRRAAADCTAAEEVSGERNEQYRHGERTKAAIAEWQKLSALLKMLRAGLTWIPGKLRDLSKGYFATTFLSSKMALQRAIAS
jgi:hypothetical protein